MPPALRPVLLSLLMLTGASVMAADKPDCIRPLSLAEVRRSEI